MLNLDEAIENPFKSEEFQLKNWLKSLREYIEKDISHGWISVNDKLPDVVRENYLCTDCNGNVGIVYRDRFANGDCWMNGMSIRDDIIAWQPIPEAYKKV